MIDRVLEAVILLLGSIVLIVSLLNHKPPACDDRLPWLECRLIAR
jgi:hypothetical protein